MEVSSLITLQTATNPLNYFAASLVGKWTAATRPTFKPTQGASMIKWTTVTLASLCNYAAITYSDGSDQA